MSIFRPLKLICPACQANIEFSAVHSVNADRRPDLRAGILDETFQEETCPQCGEGFRLDPEFNLMDTKRGQWLAAAPLAKLPDWVEVEKHARELFERAYGPASNPAAQEIGKNLTPRITFGWPAVREKVLVSEYLLDDVVLELCKMFVMRNSDSFASAETELRLIDVVDGDLVLGWVMTADETPGPAMRVARTVYDQIAEDDEGDWEEFKEAFHDVLFVDLNRMLMAGTPRPLAAVVPSFAGGASASAAEPPGATTPDEEEEEVTRAEDLVEEDEDGAAGDGDDGDAPEK